MIKTLNIYYYNTSDNIIEKNNKFLKNITEDLNVNIITSSTDIVTKLNNIYKTGGLVISGDLLLVNNDIVNVLLNDMFFVYDNYNNISENIFYVKDIKNEKLKNIINDLKNSDNNLDKVINQVYDNLVINKTTEISNNSYVYSREYFYPIGINRYEENISENTLAINLSRKLFKNEIFLVNKIIKYGVSSTRYIITLKDIIRNNIGNKKYALKRKILKSDIKYNKESMVINKAINKIKNEYANNRYIVFHNKRWLGVTSASYELFDNLVNLEEISKKIDAKKIAKAIIKSGIKQVVFSGFCYGWDNLAIEIKKYNKNIKIKCFFHGSHSQIIETVNNELYMKIIKLHKNRIIDRLATCKQSLYEFYKQQGFDVYFIKNTVKLNEETKTKILNLQNEIKENNLNNEILKDKIKIGIYAAGIDWRKNMYNSFASVATIDNAIIDTVVISNEINEFCKYHNIKFMGSETRVEREKLLSKMSLNDINLYVTFSECAPMLPLESLEMGSICITGNNHHYFNKELSSYIVVDREDDIISIKEKIENCLENKETIIKLYKKWKESYDSESKKSVKEFLNK